MTCRRKELTLHGISCDRCGATLLVNESVRYVLRLEVFAAYDPLELTREDLNRDFAAEFRAALAEVEKRDAAELSDEVYAARKYDLCQSCRRAVLARPFS